MVYIVLRPSSYMFNSDQTDDRLELHYEISRCACDRVNSLINWAAFILPINISQNCLIKVCFAIIEPHDIIF